MDENCHVEPIYKNGISTEELRNADSALQIGRAHV